MAEGKKMCNMHFLSSPVKVEVRVNLTEEIGKLERNLQHEKQPHL
jgi:hypothetical protein